VILLIDDDDDYRRACCEVLTLSGFPTAGAADDREAMELLGRGGVKLILLDLTMPRVNGWQLHAQLRADPRLASIPVVALTAGEGRLDGVEQLSKLVGLSELLAVVRRYCPG
jgi:CheY-like chemotaxis protein